MSPGNADGRPRARTANHNTSEKNFQTGSTAPSVSAPGVRPRDWTRSLHTVCHRCGRPVVSSAGSCWCPRFLHPLKSGRSVAVSTVLAVAGVLADTADRRGYVLTTSALVAAGAGVSPRTARRALRLLAQQGFLELCRKVQRYEPAVYRLTRRGGDRDE